MIISESILNRLRGTGVIKHFGTLKVFNKEIKIKFVGNHLYGLWIALVLGNSNNECLARYIYICSLFNW